MLFIAAILAYALTAGKRDMKRLDAWMSRKLTPRERPARQPAGRPCPDRG